MAAPSRRQRRLFAAAAAAAAAAAVAAGAAAGSGRHGVAHGEELAHAVAAFSARLPCAAPAAAPPRRLRRGGGAATATAAEAPAKVRPPAPLWQSFGGDPPALPDGGVKVLEGRTKELHVARLYGFLDPEDILAVHDLARDPGAWEIHDRHAGLKFYHQVWRIEEVVRARHPDLYFKLVDAAEAVDRRLWQSIRDFACPEIEYIVYDVEALGRHGSISKHTDNESCVSMVALLSDTSDFEGGINCFAGKPPRKVSLSTGDAVFFHGHGCEHWITPVTSGRRVILQMELRDTRLTEVEEAAKKGRRRRR